ncbi:MAG TPA: carboxypeptidase-like regulatory domain-containing protein [Candidatus Aquilonibacter sp.]|nr:carboxypeptidase-like regulatory domain-containing protein [Candidatus Aquilonibacter sp.]
MKRVTQAGLGLCGVVWMLLMAPSAHTQDGPPIVGPTIQIGPPQVNQQRVLATVTGKVMCSDTQQAARFATVMLINADQVTESQGRGGFGFGRRVTARTDLNGNFSLQAEPGDYYVTATATGYASPVAELAARLNSGATAADLLSALPQVHVAEAGGATVNVTIDRGAVIQGKMQWDDGSPAAGVNVSVQPTTTATGTTANDLTRVVSELGGGFGGGFGGFQTSDDRGVFRIMGLPPGSYWVRATVMTPSAEPGTGTFQRMTSVTFYAPGKARRSDAQVVTVKSGEERDDVTFMLDLSSLHTVSGHVSATDDSTIAAGVVRLTDQQDSTLTRMAMIEPDGSFVVQWVPAGTYTLAVTNASNVPRQMYGGRRGQQNDGSSTSYQPFQESLSVTDGDVSGVGVTLTPATGSQ